MKKGLELFKKQENSTINFDTYEDQLGFSIPIRFKEFYSKYKLGTLNIEDFDGVKLLKEQMPQRIKNKYPDSFEDQTKAYWEEINQPWLDEAIENGADIRFIQDPRLQENAYHVVTDKQKLNPLFKNMTKHKTYLRIEYEYLVNKGYKLLDNGLMVKIN